MNRLLGYRDCRPEPLPSVVWVKGQWLIGLIAGWFALAGWAYSQEIEATPAPPASTKATTGADVADAADAAEPPPTRREPIITDARVGYQLQIPVGCWTPLQVDLTAGDKSITNGTLEIISVDGADENLETRLVKPRINVPSRQTQIIHHYVKLSQAHPTLKLQVRDEKGYLITEARYDIGTRQGEKFIAINEKLILTFSSVTGLYSAAIPLDKAGYNPNQVVCRLATAEQMPTQWFAYGNTSAFVLGTADQNTLEQLQNNPLRLSALRTWVRQGGHLVISVADKWQLVQQSELGEMLPATLVGIDRITSASELVAFANAGEMAEQLVVSEKKPWTVAQLENIRGQVLLYQGEQPLIVEGPYGLGRVTLLTFDTEEGAFRNWGPKEEANETQAARSLEEDFLVASVPDRKRGGHELFWRRLLNFSETGLEQNRFGAVAYSGIDDLGAALTHKLEDFPQVTIVPFGWVALLIFGYILLIGPIDYFFLKKVVGRLELTWITFPVWVILISVLAYYAAYWLKGDELRINRYELVDVDAESRTLRGTSFTSIFSPRIDRYDLALTPQLAAAGPWSNLGLGKDQSDHLVSWLGKPGNVYRGLNAPSGGASLFGRKRYDYANDQAQGLEQVPIQVWSVKAFESRWLAQAADVVTGDLSYSAAGDLILLGSLTNHLPIPLTGGVLIYQIPDTGYLSSMPIPTLEPNTTIVLESLNYEKFQISSSSKQVTRSDQITLDSLMSQFAFSKHREGGNDLLPNEYLKFLDLSSHLQMQRAAFWVKLPETSGGELWLQELPAPDGSNQPPRVPGKQDRQTWLRVFLPIKKPGATN